MGAIATIQEAQSADGHANCKCSGGIPTTVPREACSVAWAPGGQCVMVDSTYGDLDYKKYSAEYGKICEAHMEPAWADCFTNVTSGDPEERNPPAATWCTDAWCYVDQCKCDAPDVKKSSAFAPDNSADCEVVTSAGRVVQQASAVVAMCSGAI